MQSIKKKKKNLFLSQKSIRQQHKMLKNNLPAKMSR
jgi:hypothetical protein